MTNALAAKSIAALGVAFICMSGAYGQAPRSNEPVSVWSSRTGLSSELREFPPPGPDNEVGANTLQLPWWQRPASLSDHMVICEPAR